MCPFQLLYDFAIYDAKYIVIEDADIVVYDANLATEDADIKDANLAP